MIPHFPLAFYLSTAMIVIPLAVVLTCRSFSDEDIKKPSIVNTFVIVLVSVSLLLYSIVVGIAWMCKIPL